MNCAIYLGCDGTSSQWKKCGPLGKVLLKNPGSGHSWWTCATCSTHLNIAANQVHAFMTIMFPGGSGLLKNRVINSATHCSGMKSTGIQIPQIFSLAVVCAGAISSIHAPASPRNLQYLNDLLLLFWCQILQDRYNPLGWVTSNNIVPVLNIATVYGLSYSHLNKELFKHYI